MVFTEATWNYFARIPFHVRAAVTPSPTHLPFAYAEEPFFDAYQALHATWTQRQSQRHVAHAFKLSRTTLRHWEERFVTYGTLGLLPPLATVAVAAPLEALVVLIKAARPHEGASLALRLAQALDVPGASLELIRHIQRCYGYGHRLDDGDRHYFEGLQHILASVQRHQQHPTCGHRKTDRVGTFLAFVQDPLQHRVELFKTLSQCTKRRQIRPLLTQYGVHPNRFYTLKERYLKYGIWGLVDLVQTTKRGEKISPELELQIIEQRLMNPRLSTTKMIQRLGLKCSRAHVQKVYSKWGLARFKQPIALRGVIAQPPPEVVAPATAAVAPRSCKALFPTLIETANLKVHRSFLELLNGLAYRRLVISNPGALIAAPFLEQLGVIEALHTYGPPTPRATEITNGIIVNVLRIIAGFPTLADFTLNSDRSVAFAAGLALNPQNNRCYDSLDELRFHHLQPLRNDAARRAVELGITEGKAIAIDYHCDPVDSRFPHDKALSKAPDQNGDLVYAHRPQILWDSMTNSIINIAYCEGRSRAPSALYRFCEQNLFKVIEPAVVSEIYADSEYTGERQLIYLMIRAGTDITMCLKQNPKIKKWKEATLRQNQWQSYGHDYRLASQDITLAETGKGLRFVVKQHLETGELRCFGSTHLDYTPTQILDAYRIRWPVESGIKDLVENYFLNQPTGTSPEKVEVHYYCVMLARLTIDYFLTTLGEAPWRSSHNQHCVLSTIRTTLFSNQNCELSLHDSGDLQLTYLDGDPLGIKQQVADLLATRAKLGLNQVSWWGHRGLRIRITNQYDF